MTKIPFLLKTITVLVVVFSAYSVSGLLKESSNNQPLSNLDKLVRQSGGQARLENLVDSKLASNITNVLNDLFATMNKVVLENKKLSSQIQEVMVRVQNTTGINGTSTFVKLQQQAPNMTTGLNELSLSNLNNFNNLASRFQN